MHKIYVKINKENLNKVLEKTGFLDRKNYPEFHEEHAKENEIGSFLDFRFILED